MDISRQYWLICPDTCEIIRLFGVFWADFGRGSDYFMCSGNSGGILPQNSANLRWLQPTTRDNIHGLDYIAPLELPFPGHRGHHRVYREETGAAVPVGFGGGG